MRSLALLGALCALAPAAAAQGFEYTDFSNTAGLALNGDALQSGSTLRLTSSVISQKGSAWWDQPVLVANGFETTFDFRITDPVMAGGDGFVFVIHNDPDATAALTVHAAAMGYGRFANSAPDTGLLNSVAIEFDVYNNGNWGDTNGNHVSVHTNGTGENTQDETLHSLGMGQPGVTMKDGQVHTALIRLSNGQLEVFVDDLVNPVVSVPYDFNTGGTWSNGGTVGGIDMIGGDMAWVGFTAGCGGAYENHDILNWKWDYPAGVTSALCFGDGSGTTCPCGNAGGAGEGCANSTGSGASFVSTGSLSVGADDLGFDAVGLLPNQPALLFVGDNAIMGGAGIPFGDGLRCAGLNVVRLGVETPSAGGTASWGPGLGATGGWTGGETRYFQVWYRDPAGGPCGTGFNLSHALEAVFLP